MSLNKSIIKQLETSVELWTLVSVDMSSSPPKITELSKQPPARRTLINFLLHEYENFAPISSSIRDVMYARQEHLQEQQKYLEQKQLEQDKKENESIQEEKEEESIQEQEKKEQDKRENESIQKQQEQEKKEQLKQLPLKSLLSDSLKTGWSALLFLEGCCHPANYFVVPLEEKPLRDWWFKHYSANNVDPTLIKELQAIENNNEDFWQLGYCPEFFGIRASRLFHRPDVVAVREARERENASERENLKKLCEQAEREKIEREEEEKAKYTIMSLIGRFPRLRNYVKEFFEESSKDESTTDDSEESTTDDSEDDSEDESTTDDSENKETITTDDKETTKRPPSPNESTTEEA